MQIDIIVRDLDKSETIEAHIMNKLGSTIENFLKNDENGHATVRIEMERHRTLNRRPSYSCEVIVKPSYQRRTIKVSKSGEDFHAAANEAAAALRTVLRRRSARKYQHRRHEHPRELRELLIAS